MNETQTMQRAVVSSSPTYTTARVGVGTVDAATRYNASHRIVAHPQGIKNIEGAVYGYITAVRALGRVSINTAEIAKALKLPLTDVDKAAKRLTRKGVKIAA